MLPFPLFLLLSFIPNLHAIPCTKGSTCICRDSFCIFEETEPETILICTNKATTCQVTCQKDECNKISIISSALETNILCNDENACNEISLLITDKLPNSITPELNENDFNGIKQSANVYCMALKTCLKARIIFDAEFRIDPVIDANAEFAFSDGSLECYRNVCQCNNCPVRGKMELSPIKKILPMITIPENVNDFILLCGIKDGCKDVVYNIDSPNVKIDCLLNSCEGITFNLNYVQNTPGNGNVDIFCSSCTKSNFNINGKYARVSITGDINSKSLTNAKITTILKQESCTINCELDSDGKPIGCDNLLISEECQCNNCPDNGSKQSSNTNNNNQSPTPQTASVIISNSKNNGNTFEILDNGDRICDNKLGRCVIECKNNDCKKQRFRSSSKNTVITCYQSACEEAMFIVGDQDEGSIDALGLNIRDFRGGYDQFILNCDEPSSCKKANIELNGQFSSVIITGNGADALTDSFISCNTRKPSTCEVHCSNKACNNIECNNQCKCNNLNPDLPGCPIIDISTSNNNNPSQIIIEGEIGGIYECNIGTSFCFLYCIDYKEQCKDIKLITYATNTQVLCQTDKACAGLTIVGGQNEFGQGIQEISVTCSGDGSYACEKLSVDVTGNFKKVSIIGEDSQSIKEPFISCDTTSPSATCELNCGIDGNNCDSIKKEFLTGKVSCIGIECGQNNQNNGNNNNNNGQTTITPTTTPTTLQPTTPFPTTGVPTIIQTTTQEPTTPYPTTGLPTITQTTTLEPTTPKPTTGMPTTKLPTPSQQQ